MEIAVALEEVDRAGLRAQKVDVIGSLLKRTPPEILRPIIRLVSGELWPSWESREMGIGPDILGEALRELSGRGSILKATPRHLGDLAEMAVLNRSQQSLTSSEMDAVWVHDALRQISAQKGSGSLFRKKSILKGLLMNASPLEAKYIARTVLGRMTVGIGPSLISAAIGKAFSLDPTLVKRAYYRLPDLGMVALHAFNGEIFEVKLAPPNPARFMPLRRLRGLEEPIKKAEDAAFIIRYGGLRVQIHKLNDRIFIYTSRLRNVTPSLADLAQDIKRAKLNLIVEGELILVRDGRVLPTSEMVGRLNLKGRSPGPEDLFFAASDLLFFDGGEVIDERYAIRRQLLKRALSGVAGTPFREKVFLAEERALTGHDQVLEMLRRSIDRGYAGLFIRHLDGAYTPGRASREDAVVFESPPL